MPCLYKFKRAAKNQPRLDAHYRYAFTAVHLIEQGYIRDNRERSFNVALPRDIGGSYEFERSPSTSPVSFKTLSRHARHPPPPLFFPRDPLTVLVGDKLSISHSQPSWKLSYFNRGLGKDKTCILRDKPVKPVEILCRHFAIRARIRRDN